MPSYAGTTPPTATDRSAAGAGESLVQPVDDVTELMGLAA
jgi:hypothetical protein